MAEEFHCYECGGYKIDYDCSTCDGKGNPKLVETVNVTKPKSSKKKVK